MKDDSPAWRMEGCRNEELDRLVEELRWSIKFEAGQPSKNGMCCKIILKSIIATISKFSCKVFSPAPGT